MPAKKCTPACCICPARVGWHLPVCPAGAGNTGTHCPVHDERPTKYGVLSARAFAAQALADRLRTELEGLDRSPCGLTCDGCGETLATEGDFARHFTVTDTRYLNLGWCPNSDRERIAAGGDPR